MKITPPPTPEKELFRRPLIWFITSILWMSGVVPAGGIDSVTPRIAVLLSKNIRPYLEAADGFGKVFDQKSEGEINIYPLESYEEKPVAVLKKELLNGRFLMAVGIGPEAVQLMGTDLSDVPFPMVYTMVLHTQRLNALDRPNCGIPLNIPVGVQLNRIREGLPSIRRLGLLYDPSFNTPFSVEALIYSRPLGIEIIPLAVSSKKDIPEILQSNWEKIDGLWMIPDQTVISESIIQYVIKQALFQKKPVIGYNRFFYESGAALAFIFDYEELGLQTANIALTILEEGYCREEPPIFHTWLNQRVLKRIGMSAPDIIEVGIEKGP